MEEHFDKSVDEIRDGGAEFLSNLVHPDSTKVVVPQLLGQLQQKDPFQSLTVFQLMRSKPDAEFEWFYTVSKKHAETGGLISLTNPIRSLGFLAEKLECVIEEHVFMKENYRRFMTLTRREREILGLIAQGETHKRIADRLYISPFTVKSHRQNIIRKLETRRIADFIKYAEMFDLD
ncbi:MAG: helix-turn-helix transcriptional regulator [candidate division Zixibacteria bacterium]|nr:helix-turn-helix transcriptional regulator [candidate division Zixibacteria bacterium]